MRNTPNLEKVLIAAENLRGKTTYYKERGYRLSEDLGLGRATEDRKLKIRSADDLEETATELQTFDEFRIFDLEKKEFNQEAAAEGFIGRIVREIRKTIVSEGLIKALKEEPSIGLFEIYLPHQAFTDAMVFVEQVEKELIDEINSRINEVAQVHSVDLMGETQNSRGYIEVRWQNKIQQEIEEAYYESVALPWDTEEFGSVIHGLFGEEAGRESNYQKLIDAINKERNEKEDEEFTRGFKITSIIGISSWIAAGVALTLLLNTGKNNSKIEQPVSPAPICRVSFEPPNKYAAECEPPYEASGQIEFPETSLEQQAAGQMLVTFYVADETGNGKMHTVEVEDMSRTYLSATLFDDEVK